MALEYATDVSTIATNQFWKGAIDNAYNSSAAWSAMEGLFGATKSGGVNVEHFVESAQSTEGGAYTVGDVRTFNVEQKLTKAYFPWKSYEWPAVIRYYDWERTVDDYQKVDLIKFQVDSAAKKAMTDIVTDFFSANDSTSTGVTGMRKICKASDTSNPLGTISTADISTWALTTTTGKASYDTATTVIRASVIKDMMKVNISLGDPNRVPDVILTTIDVYSKIENELLSTGTLQYDTNKKMIDLGFKDKGIKIAGATMYFDYFCPSTSATAGHYVFFLNSNRIHYTKNSHTNMKQSGWTELESPKGGTKANHLKHTCCVSVDERRAFGVYTAINPTL